MPTKNLVATFATNRFDFITRLASADAMKAGGMFSRLAITPRPSETAPSVEVRGPAHDVMFLIGAVADQGEDFLLMVAPC